MRLVRSVPELIEAARRFHSLAGGTEAERQAYRNFVANGHNFFVTESGSSLAFAPSRYVGYWNNSPAKHAKNYLKHGSETDRRIRSIVGWKPSPNLVLETEYQRFCRQIGVSQPQKRPRKFWELQDLYGNVSADLLDLLEPDADRRTSKRREVDGRLGQGRFREEVLELWGRKCALTQCRFEPVLKASHIRPWADCTSGDRLNKYNGIALSANADALFDRYLISFNDSGKILISPNLPPGLLKTLGLNPNQEISSPALCRPFLNYHRRMFKTKNNARG